MGAGISGLGTPRGVVARRPQPLAARVLGLAVAGRPRPLPTLLLRLAVSRKAWVGVLIGAALVLGVAVVEDSG